METLHVLTFGYDDVIVKFKRFTGTLSGKKKKEERVHRSLLLGVAYSNVLYTFSTFSMYVCITWKGAESTVNSLCTLLKVHYSVSTVHFQVKDTY